jgi:hypothetical protein
MGMERQIPAIRPHDNSHPAGQRRKRLYTYTDSIISKFLD